MRRSGPFPSATRDSRLGSAQVQRRIPAGRCGGARLERDLTVESVDAKRFQTKGKRGNVVALMTCPDCGQSVSDAAAACVHCGRPLDRAEAVAARLDQSLHTSVAGASRVDDLHQSSPRAATLPLFPVATQKFIVLSIFSFSIYESYWCYQNWKRLKSTSGENVSPFWRAFFSPFWGFSLFGRIRATAASNGVVTKWRAGILGAFYLVLSLLWRLPDPWWLISVLSFVPLIPVQQAAQRVNALHAVSGAEGRNDKYTTANVVTILIGGLLLILVIVGSFMPE